MTSFKAFLILGSSFFSWAVLAMYTLKSSRTDATPKEISVRITKINPYTACDEFKKAQDEFSAALQLLVIYDIPRAFIDKWKKITSKRLEGVDDGATIILDGAGNGMTAETIISQELEHFKSGVANILHVYKHCRTSKVDIKISPYPEGSSQGENEHSLPDSMCKLYVDENSRRIIIAKAFDSCCSEGSTTFLTIKHPPDNGIVQFAARLVEMDRFLKDVSDFVQKQFPLLVKSFADYGYNVVEKASKLLSSEETRIKMKEDVGKGRKGIYDTLVANMESIASKIQEGPAPMEE